MDANSPSSTTEPGNALNFLTFFFSLMRNRLVESTRKAKAILPLRKAFLLGFSMLLATASFANWDIFQSYIIVNPGSGDQYLAGGINGDGAAIFAGIDFGSFDSFSGNLTLNGGEIKTYKDGSSNVCGGTLHYKIYAAGSPSGSFSQISLTFAANLPNTGDQKWDATGQAINLLNGLSPGDYTLEVYWEAEGNQSDAGGCGEFKFDSDFSNNFKATFSVTADVINITQNTAHATIQDAIDNASPGDEITIAAGDYTEQLEIDKELTLTGAGMGVTNIYGYANMPISFTTSAANTPIMYVHGVDNVFLSGFTVDGLGLGSSNARYVGVAFSNAGGNIDAIEITQIRDTPFNGNQRGVGLLADVSDGISRNLSLKNSNIHDIQKNAITISGENLFANIESNSVTGAGSTTVIGQNGVQIGFGATGYVKNNTITGFDYTPGNWLAAGILLINSTGNIVVENNTVNNCQGSIALQNGSATILSNTIDNATYGILSYSLTSGVNVVVDAIGNTISNSDVGMLFYSTDGTTTALAHNNSITDTDDLIANINSDMVDASCNWYGTTDATEIDSKISGDVQFMPFLVNGDINNPDCSGIGPVRNITQGTSFVQIQAAIDDPTTVNGDIIEVDPGFYPQNIVVNKELEIRGPNFGIDPNTGTRGAEAILAPSDTMNLANPEDDFSAVIEITAENVTIDGFRVTGDNGIGTTNYVGLNIQAGTGIAVAESGATIQNNIVDRNTFMGIWTYRTLSEVNSNGPINNVNISNNLIEDIHDIRALGYGFALYLQGSNGIVMDNVVHRARNGLQVQPYGASGIGVVANNSFETYKVGMWYNYASPGSGSWTFEGNSILGVNPPASFTGGPVTWSGIMVQTMQLNGGSAVFQQNSIDGGVVSISSADYDEVIGYRVLSPNNNSADINTFSNNAITNVETFIYNQTTQPLNATCNWYGTTDAQTIADNINGDATYIPFLIPDNAGSGYSWSGSNTYSCTGVEPVRVYDIDPGSPGANLLSSHSSIQDGVDAAVTGNFVQVDAGIYDEVVTIDKGLSLIGPNVDISAVTGTRVPEARLLQRININQVDDVTVSGFEFFEVPTTSTWTIYIQGNSNNYTFANNRFIDITNDAIRSGINSNTGNITVTGNLIDGLSGTNSSGILLGGIFGTSVISDNKIDLAFNGTPTGYSGIQTPGATGLIISGNEISNTTNQGIQLAGACGDVNINHNSISNANTSSGSDKGAIRLYGNDFTGSISITNNVLTNSFNGVAVKDGQDIAGKDITIENNDLSGNSNAAIYNGATAGTLDATCNWYGTANPATIENKIDGDVTWSPLLLDGTDNNASEPGFDPAAPCEDLPHASYVMTTPTATVNSCQVFTVLVSVENTYQINFAEAYLNFDPSLLQVMSIEAPGGGSLPGTGAALPFVLVPAAYDNLNGTLQYGAGLQNLTTNSSFDFFQITFKVIGGPGTTSITHSLVGTPKSMIVYITDSGSYAESFNILDSAEPLNLTLGGDQTPPVASCKDITLELGSSGTALLSTNAVDNGSYDECSNAVSLAIDRTFFDCTDVSPAAPNEIWINEFHYDNSGTDNNEFVEVVSNFDAAGYQVVLYNGSAGTTYDTYPIGSVTNSAGWYYYVVSPSSIQNGDPDGFALIDDNNNVIEFLSYGGTFMATNGPASGMTSTDVGVEETNSTTIGHSLQLTGTGSQASDFTWSDPSAGSPGTANAGQTIESGVVGTPVTLTVTDGNNNTSTCTAHVTVVDNLSPTVSCKDFSVSLDSTGNASIVAADINDGSTDNCGIASTSIDKTDFTCADIGENTVTLTVTDVNGNVTTCTSTLTVTDDIDPVAVCQDITVQLDGSGNVSVAATDLDGGSTDNCAVASVAVLGCPGDLLYDQNATPEFIAGSGISNGGFTTDSEGGVELNLRAKVRYPSPANIFNSNGDGSYNQAVGAFGSGGIQSSWNFDWSINTDPTGSSGQKLDELTYELGIDYDPTDGVDFVTFDLINAPYFDHAIGDNSTGNGAGTVAANPTEYAALIDANNVAQNSWRPNFFGSFDGTVDGRYDIYLKAFDTNGDEVASTAITVIAGNGTGNPYIGCLIPMSSIDFDCADVGANDINLVVYDASGNSSSCTATVTVEDNVAPTAVCQNIDVYVDANGNANITAADIDGGSSDNCGPITLSASQTAFDCGDVSGQAPAPTYALIITGILDGPLTGGTPKALELYVAQDIPDLSIYGLGKANNGNASSGQEFTFVGSATAGSYLYVSTDQPQFNSFFGFDPDFTDNVVNVNGDDVVELYENESVIDAFGELGVDGSGTAWKYQDGWAYRNNGTTPNGGTFNAANWTYSGPDALDGETSNASAATPFPIGTFGPSAAPAGTTVTLTVTDSYGNTSTCDATVTVLDAIPPTAVCQNITAQLDASGSVTIDPETLDNGSSDNCSTNLSFSLSQTEFDCSNLGENTVTLTVTDDSGNESTCTPTVTIEDLIQPTITCPSDATVELSTAPDPFITGMATGSDNCTFDITFADDRSGLAACGTGTLIRTFTATDGSGNIATCNQNITIIDTELPVLTCPADITVSTDPGICGAAVNFGSTDPAYDNKYIESFENPDFVAGDPFHLQNQGWNEYGSSIARVTTGTDGIASSDGSAHIQIDTTNSVNNTGAFSRLGGYSPEFGDGYTVQADVFMDLNDAGVTNDTYGWDLSVSSSTNSGGFLRDFIFHTASDASGNILVGADNNSSFTRKTTIESGNHYTLSTSGWYTYEWVFRDNGSDQLAVDMNLKDASGTVLWTETRSTPADVISTLVGGNRYMWFTFLEVEKLAVDNIKVLRNVSTTCTAESGDTFNVGTTTVTCSGTDACGNTVSCDFDVTVTDDEVPTAICKNITAFLDASGNATINASDIDYGSFDNCGSVTVSTDILSFDCSELGPNPVTLTVEDASGNTNTCTATVTVIDNIEPEAECQSVHLELDANGMATLYASQADNGSSDNCSDVNVGIVGKPVGLAYDQNATPDLIAGSGIANGGFTTDIDNGLELSLRARVRFPTPANIYNSNGDGLYDHATGTFGNDGMQSSWNFDWSINTDQTGTSGQKLDDYTYEIGIDFDRTGGVDFYAFDPINAPYFDHAIGDNSTANGGGAVAADPTEYASLIANNNVAQNSWRPNFFGAFDGNLNGRYEVYIKAFDSNGDVVAATAITVYSGTVYDVFGGSYMPLDSIMYDCNDYGTSSNYLYVTDANGNSSRCQFDVFVEDNMAPIITLLGDPSVDLCVGQPYTDAGATADDNCDGDLTGSIVVVNPVDVNTPGTYTITYNVADSHENDATEVTRTVNVGAKPAIDNTVSGPGFVDINMTSGGNYALTTCSGDTLLNSIPSTASMDPASCGELRIQSQYISTLPNIPSATLDASFADAVLAGEQEISPTNTTGTDQTITFITTPYYDADGSGSLTAGDVEGDPVTFVLTVRSQPDVNIAFNGQVAGYNASFEYCYSETVTATLDGINAGTAPFEISWEVAEDSNLNGTASGLNVGDALFSNQLDPGTYIISITSLTDANGCERADLTGWGATVVVHEAPELAVTVNGVEVGYGFNQTYCESQSFDIEFAGINSGDLPLQTLAWSITKDGNSFLSGSNTAIPQNILSGTVDPGVYVFSLDAFADANGCALPNIGAYTATITVVEQPTAANAGTDQTISETCGPAQATLAANTPTAGSGQWSIVSGSGGSFNDTSDPTAIFTGTPGETYELEWTISNAPCGASSDRVMITFDNAAPQLVAVTPVSGDYCLNGDNFIWTVQASDANLYSLEVDHSLQGSLPEFTVYADVSNPYGSTQAQADFVAAGVSVIYNDAIQEWTFDFGAAITQDFIDNGGITFYTVLADCNGNELGSMSPTTPSNTFAYTFDNVAPQFVNVAPAVGDQCQYGENFIWTVQSSDPNLYSLEVDHNMQLTLPEFTVYADVSNPYGSVQAQADFAAAGVSVIYNNATLEWTFDFGAAITQAFIDNGGITFYTVLADCNGNELGSMSPTSPSNTFAYTFDNDAPVLVDVTPVAGAYCQTGDNFIWTVQATDANLYSLEVDHSLQGSLPEFTVYADVSNPYGSAQAQADFATAGVSVIYNDATQEWTFDFGAAITQQFIDNGGITFYTVLADCNGNELGSMSPTTPSNTFAYTYHAQPDVDLAFNGQVAGYNAAFEYCYGENVSVTLAAITQGDAPFAISWEVAEDGSLDGTASGLELGDELFSNVLDPGDYTISITSVIDANGCEILDLTGWGATIKVYEELVLTCPADISVNNDAGVCEAEVSFAASYSGGDPSSTISYSIGRTPISSPYNFPSGTSTVDVELVNGCGTRTCSFDVVVTDNEAPTITCATPDATYSAEAGVCTYTVSGTGLDPVSTGDNCSVASVVNDFNNSASLQNAVFPAGSTTVTWTVTDGSGNTTSCQYDVVVVDTESPQIVCASDGNRFIDQQNNTYEVAGSEFDPTSVSDNCTAEANISVTHNAASIPGAIAGTDNTSLDGWQLPVGIHSITFTATDATANSTSCDVTIEVKALTLSGTVSMNLDCTPKPVRIEIYEVGTPNPSPVLVQTYVSQVDINGNFTVDLTGLAPGTFGIYIKIDTYFQQFYGDQVMNGATSVSITNLVPGDIAGSTFGDNVVNGVDLSVIIGAYNSQQGDANYNPRGDLNCDGLVDGLDMSLLIFHYNQTGDSPLAP